ncbi:MAG: hypothetical protein AB1781_08365 [Pseudomonadota bacterium]
MGITNLFGRARRRAILELDGLRWRRAVAPLRSAARGGAQGRLLICDLMTMIATAKAEALIAGVMRLDGIAPVVLLHRRDPVIERIYRAASPDVQFAYFDDYLRDVPQDEARREAEQLVAGFKTMESLIGYERDGVRTGRNALSTAVRKLRIGRLDMGNPDHRNHAIEGLAKSIRAARAAQTAVAGIQPDHALFNERGYTPAGEVFDACLLAGVDAIQWFGAPSSDSLMYKRYDLTNRGDHPMSISPATWAALKSEPWSDEMNDVVIARIAENYKSGAWYNRQQLQEGKVLLDAAGVRDALGLDPLRKTAVIFAHILYDATFFYGESLYPDYETWLIETVRHAAANPNLNWIVKVHPVNVWRSKMDGVGMEQLEARALKQAFGELPDHIRIMPADTNINTYALFGAIDYGLTVRGTIGMELPCFGIPVVTAGTGRYSGRGVTIDPRSPEEYAATLARLHKVPRLNDEVVRLARIHYHAAMTRRPIAMESFVLDFHANTKGLPELRQNTYVRTRPGSAWKASADLGALADWVRSRRGYELLRAPVSKGSAGDRSAHRSGQP